MGTEMKQDRLFSTSLDVKAGGLLSFASFRI